MGTEGATFLPFDDWNPDGGDARPVGLRAVPAVGISSEATDDSSGRPVGGDVRSVGLRAVPAVDMSSEATDVPALSAGEGADRAGCRPAEWVGGRAAMMARPVGGADRAGDLDPSDRAGHLARVCAGFPTSITVDGAVRLARLLSPGD